jgi:hypothetical protein
LRQNGVLPGEAFSSGTLLTKIYRSFFKRRFLCRNLCSKTSLICLSFSILMIIRMALAKDDGRKPGWKTEFEVQKKFVLEYVLC